jgi:hypothetical protein
MNPKYYLFDTGVVNAAIGRGSLSSVIGTTTYGMLFEHFVILVMPSDSLQVNDIGKAIS